MIISTCLAGDLFVETGQERGHLSASHSVSRTVFGFADTGGDTEVVDAADRTVGVGAGGYVGERMGLGDGAVNTDLVDAKNHRRGRRHCRRRAAVTGRVGSNDGKRIFGAVSKPGHHT